MNIDNAGQCIYSQSEVFNLIMQGIDIDDIYVEKDAELNDLLKSYESSDFKRYMVINDNELNSFHKLNQMDWKMPKEYFDDVYDIKETIRAKIWYGNPQYHTRIDKELEAFEHYGLLDLLKYMRYMCDTLRDRGVVWGVGRGSSVASLCLYVLGVHSVDPVKYGIDFEIGRAHV